MLLRSKSASMLIAEIVAVMGASDENLIDDPKEPASHKSIERKHEAGGSVSEEFANEESPETPVLPACEARDDLKPLDLRQRAFTRFGGLLFFIAVLEDLKVPEIILEHAVLGARDFQWVLHQLAMAILELPPDDPAALAFAGLTPDAESPSACEEGSNEVERAVLQELVATISERLHSLLELGNETNLIEFVCVRRAEIVADPGWIEVRLLLDEVSAEVRRAGLDLDPGYVSWLGVVVRFVYE